MRSLPLLLVALAFAGAIPAAAAPTPAPEPPLSGRLYVATLPVAADIWIDGTYVGHSPLLVEALSAGGHRVTVTKAGWGAQEISASVSTGTTAFASVELPMSGKPRGTGRILVRGTASAVQIDGTSVAHPDATLPAGAHTVSAWTAKGRVARRILVYPDETTVVVLQSASAEESKAAVIAPAVDYLNMGEFTVIGKRVKLTHNGFVVIGTIGETTYRIDGARVTYDAAPQIIGNRLYLPLALLNKLTSSERAK